MNTPKNPADATTSMSSHQSATIELPDALRPLALKWPWVLALGAVFIILGIIGLGMDVALTITSVLLFGVLLLVGGVAQLIEAFQCKGWKGVLWHVLLGLLYLFAGGTIWADPTLASVALTGMLACTLIVIGVVRIVLGFTHRNLKSWQMLVLGGVLSLALGAMILAHWPASGLWVIGLFVAIELVMHGVALTALALALRGRNGSEQRDGAAGASA